MSKLSNFLHLKIYRRTFLLYLLVVLIFITVMIALFYSNMVSGVLDAYAQEAEAGFSQGERQLVSVTGAIDNFFTHLYSSSATLADFFRFFGATPEAYVRARLDAAYTSPDSYLTSCNNLISDSGFTIRHMLYYSASGIVDMEYNASGYSRCRVLEAEEAEALFGGAYAYTKDIHKSASYVGKLTFLLDLSTPVAASLGEEEGACLITGSTRTYLGDPAYEGLNWEELLKGPGLGRVRCGGKTLVYRARVSERFSYTLITVAPAAEYLTGRLNQFVLFSLGVIAAFLLITFIYVRQFSSDSSFIESILHSMVKAQSEQFVPVDVGERDDEFADIAQHLNTLYDNLDTLIQQKYLLTIRQQQAEMQRLSAQLNPHFLYNTLERIRLRALSEGARDVAEATAALGLLYRNIVKTDPIIPLSRELEITEQYLDLMCFLYDEQLLYHLDVPEEMGSILTPKIWMQPIVENFFKHNFQNDGQLKVVVISAQRRPDGYLLRFFDNLGSISREQLALLNRQFTPESDASPDGIGLRNVYERLRLYYGSRVEMSIGNQQPAGVCIQVLLKDEVKH